MHISLGISQSLKYLILYWTNFILSSLVVSGLIHNFWYSSTRVFFISFAIKSLYWSEYRDLYFDTVSASTKNTLSYAKLHVLSGNEVYNRSDKYIPNSSGGKTRIYSLNLGCFFIADTNVSQHLRLEHILSFIHPFQIICSASMQGISGKIASNRW